MLSLYYFIEVYMILPKHTLAHLHCRVDLNAVPDATPQPRAREIWVRRDDTRHHLSIGEAQSHLNPALFLTSKRQTAGQISYLISTEIFGRRLSATVVAVPQPLHPRHNGT
jgi:hypothetical protein